MTLLNKKNEKQYLKYMREIAKDAGYEPKEIELAHDGKHKLKIGNIKFGNIDYPDFVLFVMNKEMNEAVKHRKNYLTRTANMKGNWKNNPFSRNNLSRRIIWFSMD
jgi:hypothetical protein